jgi:cytochrome b pre-mRNA-processing protein 3
MSIWPFGRSKLALDSARLLQTVTNVSRRPVFFGEHRVPDTLEGRFEVVVLHAWLALNRLRDEPSGAALAQAYTDRLFRHLDAGLRESGVGDLSVSKRMRKLAASFRGRLGAYGAAHDANNQEALAAALARNMLGPEDHPFAAVLAAYARAAAAALRAAPPDALFEFETWPLPGS